jgi:enoyl-CoA hydratase
VAVRVEQVLEHVPEVVLDAPPVNAFDTAGFLELAATVTALGRRPDTRVVLLRSGIEKGFMAGVDVKEMSSGGPRAVVAVNRACAEAYAALYDCEVPVVAAVHGFCLATGVGLCGNADIVVASDDATFGLPEVDRGGLGSSTQLQRLVPPHRARWMALSCERAPAAELLRYGSVERVVPRADLLDTARELATTVAAKSPLVIRRAKESLNAIDPVDVKRSFRREMGFTFELNLTPVAEEARQDFLSERSERGRTGRTSG